MKRTILNLSALCITLVATGQVLAADLTKNMDSLGANKELIKKAKAIDPQNRVRVVQNRDVDRYMRFELGVNGGMVMGGDPYTNTNIVGGNLDFHITPRWSIGARYENIANSLTSEGKKTFEFAESGRAASTPGYRQPGIDWAKESWLAVVNWYPIYGKLNLFDMGISQFDIYLLGGGGQINLQSSGSTALYTVGAGVGLWLTQHFATRLEARWQGYQDNIFDGIDTQKRNIDQTVLNMSVSFLL